MNLERRSRFLVVALISAALAAAILAFPSRAARNRGGAEPVCPADEIKPVGTRYKRGINCRDVEIDGYPRRFIVYVPTDPDFDLNQDHPLVFMFHGTSGTGEKFYNISGWREKADQEGLIAVFPTALTYLLLDSGKHKTRWNGFELSGQVDLDDKPNGYPASAPWPANDVGFVDTMLDDLAAETAIDPQRIFESGFSNGGQFCSRLAVERSDVFAAAACASGFLEQEHADELVAPIPIALAAGNKDDRILEVINEAEGTNLTELPLTYEEFVDHALLEQVLNVNADTFGLVRTPTGIFEGQKRMNLTFLSEFDQGDPTPLCMTFTLWDGVTHQYPNGKNNPNHFVAAKSAWKFFETTWDGCPDS